MRIERFTHLNNIFLIPTVVLEYEKSYRINENNSISIDIIWFNFGVSFIV